MVTELNDGVHSILKFTSSICIGSVLNVSYDTSESSSCSGVKPKAYTTYSVSGTRLETDMYVVSPDIRILYYRYSSRVIDLAAAFIVRASML